MTIELTTTAQSLMNEGDELFKQKQYQEAINKYKQVIQDNPNYIPALNKIASSHEGLNQLQNAFINYQRVIELRPKSSKVQAKLANILMKQEKVSEAISAYRKAIKLEPNQSEKFYFHFAKSLTQDGQIDAAIQAYKKAFEINPNSRQVCLNLGRAYIEKAKLMAKASEKVSA